MESSNGGDTLEELKQSIESIFITSKLISEKEVYIKSGYEEVHFVSYPSNIALRVLYQISGGFRVSIYATENQNIVYYRFLYGNTCDEITDIINSYFHIVNDRNSSDKKIINARSSKDQCTQLIKKIFEIVDRGNSEEATAS